MSPLLLANWERKKGKKEKHERENLKMGTLNRKLEEREGHKNGLSWVTLHFTWGREREKVVSFHMGEDDKLSLVSDMSKSRFS